MGKGMKRNEHMEETTEGKRIRKIKKAQGGTSEENWEATQERKTGKENREGTQEEGKQRRKIAKILILVSISICSFFLCKLALLLQRCTIVELHSNAHSSSAREASFCPTALTASHHWRRVFWAGYSAEVGLGCPQTRVEDVSELSGSSMLEP